MTRTTLTFFYITILLLAAPLAKAAPKFSYVSDPSLPDIAAVTYRVGKMPVISINPALCIQAGASLCEFYRYHEIAHIVLHHQDRDYLTVQEKENEADRWAAKYAPMHCVKAAYRFFSSGGGSTPNHGSSRTRAERMIASAGTRYTLN